MRVTNDGRVIRRTDLLLRMMWLSPSGLVTRPMPDLSSSLAVTSRVMSDPCLKYRDFNAKYHKTAI